MKHWSCPNCVQLTVTTEQRPHTPFHACPGLKGLTAPFIEDGTKAKLTVVERGDWVGRELVQTDGEGRPVMAVVTTRDDGEDCTVYAPTASFAAEGT